MKKKAISLMLALASVGCFLFTSCGGNEDISLGGNSQVEQESQTPQTDEGKIRATIAKFVKVYNDGDFEAFLSCLEPKLRNTTRSLFNVLGGVTGGLLGVDISFSDLFTLGIGMQGASDVLRVEIEKIEIGTNDVSVTTKTTYAGDCETTYFLMVEEAGEWLISDIVETKPSIIPATGMTVTPVGGFIGDIIIIKYTLDGKEYNGLMNTNGQIIYTFESGTEYIMNYGDYMGDGSVIMEESSGRKKIISNVGKIVAIYEKDAFDKVISVGDSHALVYKEENGINGLVHYYGVISSLGEWVMPLREMDFDRPGATFIETDFLLFCDGDRYGYDYLVYNLKTKQEVALQAEEGMRDLMYGLCNDCLYIVNEDFYYLEDGTKIEANFKIAPDCSITNIDVDTSYITITGDYFVYEDEATGYTVFDNIITRNKSEYTDYVGMGKTVTYVGDYFLLKIVGLNGKPYATLIDLNCVQQFELIELKDYDETIVYSEGYIMYSSKGSYIDTVLDIKGNIVLQDVHLWTVFYNGIAVAKDVTTGELIFINIKGEPAFEKYYING